MTGPRLGHSRRCAPITASARPLLRASVLLTALLCSRVAQAYRPFPGTDADVSALGELELECGTTGLYRGGGLALVAPDAVLNYGFAKDWEAVLEARHVLNRTEETKRVGSHLEDPALLVKSVLRDGVLQARTGPSIAVEGGLLLPTPEGRAGVAFAAIFSTRWRALTLHVNLDNTYIASEGYAPTLGVIIEGPGGSGTRPVAELSVGGKTASRTLTWSALLGLIHPAAENLALDFAVRGSRVGTSFEGSVSLGLTWTLELGRSN
jgi:hypothetical protein